MTELSELTRDLVARVKQYALAHYEQNGWDVLIECHTDEEIAVAIGKATTEKSARTNVRRNLGIGEYHSHRRDIQGTAF